MARERGLDAVSDQPRLTFTCASHTHAIDHCSYRTRGALRLLAFFRRGSPCFYPFWGSGRASLSNGLRSLSVAFSEKLIAQGIAHILPIRVDPAGMIHNATKGAC